MDSLSRRKMLVRLKPAPMRLFAILPRIWRELWTENKNQWSEIYHDSSVAFKIELRHTTEPEAISVWLRLGEYRQKKLLQLHFKKT